MGDGAMLWVRPRTLSGSQARFRLRRTAWSEDVYAVLVRAGSWVKLRKVPPCAYGANQVAAAGGPSMVKENGTPR